MTDVRLLRLLAQQLDIIAWWQLRALGWSPRRVDSTVRRRHWQVVHDGVYAAKYAPLTRMQRWIAATLTEPGTLLAGASAGACWGFRPWEASFETVVRWGSGGPRMFDDLWVSRSRSLMTWRGADPSRVPRLSERLSTCPHHCRAPRGPGQRGRRFGWEC